MFYFILQYHIFYLILNIVIFNRIIPMLLEFCVQNDVWPIFMRFFFTIMGIVIYILLPFNVSGLIYSILISVALTLVGLSIFFEKLETLSLSKKIFFSMLFIGAIFDFLGCLIYQKATLIDAYNFQLASHINNLIFSLSMLTMVFCLYFPYMVYRIVRSKDYSLLNILNEMSFVI